MNTKYQLAFLESRQFVLAATAALLAAASLTVGCASDHSSAQEFFPQQESKNVTQMCDAQAAAAAMADPTLYACHFDAGQLNSLGRNKLDLLLSSYEDPHAPVHVFIDLDHDDSGLAEAGVKQYLQTRGVPTDLISIAVGPNPMASSLASEQLSRLKKTETPAADGSNSTSSITQSPTAGNSVVNSPGGSSGTSLAGN